MAAVHMKDWIEQQKAGIHSLIDPRSISQDQAQLLAWAGAILWKPGILLVDEFDAAIHEDTVRIIDDVIRTILTDSIVIMVTHQKKSRMKVHKRIFLENGKRIDAEGS